MAARKTEDVAESEESLASTSARRVEEIISNLCASEPGCLIQPLVLLGEHLACCTRASAEPSNHPFHYLGFPPLFTCICVLDIMSKPAIVPETTASGIAVDPRTLERIIPESRRPDGTYVLWHYVP